MQHKTFHLFQNKFFSLHKIPKNVSKIVGQTIFRIKMFKCWCLIFVELQEQVHFSIMTEMKHETRKVMWTDRNEARKESVNHLKGLGLVQGQLPPSCEAGSKEMLDCKDVPAHPLDTFGVDPLDGGDTANQNGRNQEESRTSSIASKSLLSWMI